MPKKAKLKHRPKPIAKLKPPTIDLLGPKEQGERYGASARFRPGTKIEKLWLEMLKRDSFTVPQLAALGIVSKNYCKIYVRVLANAGYLTKHFQHSYGYGGNPHCPTTYKIGPHYRGKIAPQLAGGAGGGGHLSHGWKSLQKEKA